MIFSFRDELREQHALGEEIANAITNAPIGEPVDDDELEAELEGLEQEQIDERMLKTGTVPVHDDIGRMPAVGNGESTFTRFHCARATWATCVVACGHMTLMNANIIFHSQIRQTANRYPRRRRRGGRVGETPG